MKKITTDAQKRNLIALIQDGFHTYGTGENNSTVFQIQLGPYSDEGLNEDQKKDLRQYKHILNHLKFEEQEPLNVPNGKHKLCFSKEIPLPGSESGKLVRACMHMDLVLLDKCLEKLNTQIEG